VNGVQDDAVAPQQVEKKSAQGAALTTVGALLGRAAGLLATLWITHFVHKTEYGQANLALIVASVVQVATLFAPQQALLTRKDSFSQASVWVEQFVLTVGVLVFGGLFFVGNRLLDVLSAPEAWPMLRLYCVAVFCERLALCPALRLRYELRFADLTRVDAIGDAAYVIVAVSSATWGVGAVCLPLGALSRQLARLLWLRFALKLPVFRYKERLPRAARQRLRGELWPMMWPIYLASLVELSTLYLDNVFVGRVYSLSAQGLYAVGYTLLMTPSETVAMYASSALVRALSATNPQTRHTSFLLGTKYLLLVLLPLGCCAAWLAPLFESACLPEKWQGVAPVLTGFALGGVSLGLHRLSFSQLSALHKSRSAAALYGVQLVVFVGGLVGVSVLDTARLHPESVAWVSSLSLFFAAAFGTGMVIALEEISVWRFLGACVPAIRTSSVVCAALFCADALCAWLHRGPSWSRFLLEAACAVLAYFLYLVLLERRVFWEVRNFVAKDPRQVE